MAQAYLGAIRLFQDEPGPPVFADPYAEGGRFLVEVHPFGERADCEIGESDFWHGLARKSLVL